MNKTNVLINKSNSETNGGFDKSVITLTIDPNWNVPSNVEVNNHNYEVRSKFQDGDIITYSITDSGVNQ